MVNAAQMTGFHAVVANEASFLENAVAKFQKYRLFRKTVNELQSLSNRELADLGMSRSGIKGAAIEVVYGN